MNCRAAKHNSVCQGHEDRRVRSLVYSRALVLMTLFLLSLLLAWALRASVTAQSTAVVRGRVVKLNGEPAAGATVRQQTTANRTGSAPDGSFSLGQLEENQPVTTLSCSCFSSPPATSPSRSSTRFSA